MAWMDVLSGLHDCVLALGMEKVYHLDKKISYDAINAVMDKDLHAAPEQIGSALLGHAERAINYMASYGLTRQQLAMVCSKNHYNGSLNPYAQYQKPMTVDEILGFRVVADPITVPMCSPLGDGAAAVIVCSADYARRYTTHPISVATSVFRTGKDIDPGEPILTERTSRQAYEQAGIGPDEIGVFEVNNAVTFLEIEAYESLGICGRGESPDLIESRQTELGGRYAVNPSGGLESRGHPFGATGVAQITEIVWQLRGQAGERQVPGPPKSGLAEMNGGNGDPDESAAEGITILKS
jgi:acetyl-CoA acetyltransferase